MRLACGHTPHDDIFDVAVSPEYDRDGEVFVISRGILLKSTDRGANWKRIVKGLDNKYQLCSLDISAQNKHILFISSIGDGIYKSQDGGISWSKANNGLQNLNIERVCVSPHRSDLAFAVGTPSGLYRTANGGEAWHPIADPGIKPTAIAFFSHQTSSLMMGDNRGGLYLSDNHGETWKKIASIADSGAIRAMAISTNMGRSDALLIGTEKGGVIKTTDGGMTFSKVNRGLADLSVTSIALSSTDAEDKTVWVSTWKNGVFFSEDGGDTWEKRSAGLTTNSQKDEPGYKDRPHFSNLRISKRHGTNRTIFLSGFDGLFLSSDGGLSWSESETLPSTIIVGLAISPVYHEDSSIAVTTYINGAHLSNDLGATWKAINNGIDGHRRRFKSADRIARLFNIVFSPDYAKDHTLLSSSWTHFLKSTDGGMHWKEIPLIRQSWWKFATDISGTNSLLRQFIITPSPNFALDRTVYLGTRQGVIFRSNDGGESFSAIGSVPHGFRSLAISPGFASDLILYAGTTEGIYKTTDGGYTWTCSQPGIDAITNLAISPNYSVDQTVFAGTRDGLFITRDAGKYWAKLPGTLYGTGSVVEAVALSPGYREDQTLLVSVKGRGLFKSTNGGESFTAIGADLINSNHLFANFSNPTAVPILFSPFYSTDHTIYGFSGTELFKSADTGETWNNVTPPRVEFQPSMSSLVFRFFRRFSIGKLIAASTATAFSYLLASFFCGEKYQFRGVTIQASISLAVFVSTLLILIVH